MSTAFPESANPFEVRKPIKIEERGTVVPSFYRRHAKDGAGIIVKKGGVPLIPTFTVDRIPPERRWAVRENGEILEQGEFESMLEKVYTEAGRAFSGDGNTTPKGNPRLNPYPRIEKYVSVEIDPRNPRQFIPMGYVAHPEKKTQRTVPEQYFDSSGEPVQARPIDMLLDAYFEPRLRGKMLAHEVEAVEKHLREQRESKMAVEPEPEKPLKATPRRGTHVSPCGKTDVKNLASHMRFCRACKSIGDGSSQPAA